MTHALLITVRLHDRRWHGVGEWPPSPARLFQALVAGVGGSGPLSSDHQGALQWLGELPPPAIAVPPTQAGRPFVNYVPNNDLDAVGGDPDRVDEIRAGKTIRPRFIECDPALLYAWPFQPGDEADRHIPAVRTTVEELYQFGRGVDMAWATAEVLAANDAEARLTDHGGQVWHPSVKATAGGVVLRCPRPGTLKSLMDRHAAQRRRIVGGVFRKPPDPRFRTVGYNCPPDRLLLELQPADAEKRFQPWPLTNAAGLVMAVRDAAKVRLRAMGTSAAEVERFFVGLGANGADKARRVRILPLPSIGHAHTEPSIRRVLIERPPDCPIPASTLHHALSNLDLTPVDPETGEVGQDAAPVLTPTDNDQMLRHFGIGGSQAARVWHSVTPVALPVTRGRGRVSGPARAGREAGAAHAVREALRHAAIDTPVKTMRVQREPLFSKGAPAEAFAAASRFPPDRRWHVEITFARPVAGPLMIGDGRYGGLGLMAPSTADRHRDVLILPLRPDCRPAVAEGSTVVAALRRALMSLAADGDGHVSTLFSGHPEGPGPARSGQHRHVYLLADDGDGDGLLDRLIVIAPWRVDRSVPASAGDRAGFERVVAGLRTLRAGAAGVLALDPACEPAENDPMFALAPRWFSRTAYRPTRHPSRKADPAAAASDDLSAECQRRGLPRPKIEVTRVDVGPRGGLSVNARLGFEVGVAGPILLGRDAHRGGGLFIGER